MSNQARGTLLIVDDEAIIRESLQHWLELEGFRVFTAENGELALRICKSERLDVGVFDIRMPVMDGITLLAHTRSCCPELDVIMMTAFASIEDAVKCISEGAHDYIIKPFPPEKLTKSILNIIESRRLQSAQRSMVEQRNVLNRFFRECSPFLTLGTATAALSGAPWAAGINSADGGEQQPLPALIDNALNISRAAFQTENNDLRVLVETALVLADLSSGSATTHAVASQNQQKFAAPLPYLPTTLALQMLFDHFIRENNLAPLLNLRHSISQLRQIRLLVRTLLPLTEGERLTLLSNDRTTGSEIAELCWSARLLRHLGARFELAQLREGGEEIIISFVVAAEQGQDSHGG
jgi:CheY-like chemotaxis protein